MIEYFINQIQAQPGVSAIAVNGGGYPVELEQNQILPSWSYLFAGGRTDHTLHGERGPRHRRLQIDCYGATPVDCFALSEAIDAYLDGLSGVITDGGSPATTVGYILSCLMEQEPVDTFDSAARTWRRMTEYDLFFQ